jgi:hypothetical protein
VDRFREPTAAEDAAAERHERAVARAEALELRLRMAEARAIAASGVAVSGLVTALVAAAEETAGAPALDHGELLARIMADVSEVIAAETTAQIEAICSKITGGNDE